VAWWVCKHVRISIIGWAYAVNMFCAQCTQVHIHLTGPASPPVSSTSNLNIDTSVLFPLLAPGCYLRSLAVVPERPLKYKSREEKKKEEDRRKGLICFSSVRAIAYMTGAFRLTSKGYLCTYICTRDMTCLNYSSTKCRSLNTRCTNDADYSLTTIQCLLKCHSSAPSLSKFKKQPCQW
jgi:hypothetical protein